VTQNWTCWTPTFDSESCSCVPFHCERNKILYIVWLRAEHVEHQRVTQNWTCRTPAWPRTEHVEHQRVTQNWTCRTPACGLEFHSLVFMWANMKQFHRMRTDGCVIVFTSTRAVQ